MPNSSRGKKKSENKRRVWKLRFFPGSFSSEFFLLCLNHLVGTQRRCMTQGRNVLGTKVSEQEEARQLPNGNGAGSGCESRDEHSPLLSLGDLGQLAPVPLPSSPPSNKWAHDSWQPPVPVTSLDVFFFYDKLVDYLLLNSLNAWIPAMFLLLKKTFKNTLFWEFRRKRFKVFLKVSTQFKACTSSEFLFPSSWTGQE